jgi:hypothetical protein
VTEQLDFIYFSVKPSVLCEIILFERKQFCCNEDCACQLHFELVQ